VTVRDDIFPADRDPAYVQTEWAEGWGFSVIGFGYAARILTEHRYEMNASVDQIGLAIFFLQRHRVELVIKQALVDLGEEPAKVAKLGHNLDSLWQRLRTVVSANGASHWQELVDDHGEFLSVMHDADTGSFSYRYPIDKKGQPSKRAEFISLEALDRHAENFESGIHGYTDWVTEMERNVGDY
jgi:hypothetical protein